MKRSFQKSLFVVILLVAQYGYGQNEFFFNHYLLNPSYFNPAWVGVDNQAFIAAHHRTQWAGYDATFDPGGAPTTQLVSMVVPVQGKLSGLGLSLVNDKQFGLRSNQIRLQIAAKKEMRKGILSFGLSPAINIQTLDPDDFRPAEPEDFGTKQSQMRPNFHAGIYYSSINRYFVGLSVENILEPEFTMNGFDQLDYFIRNYNFFFQKELDIGRDLIFKPTLLFRSDLNSYSLDLTGILEYEEKIWGGFAYRRSESLSVLLGYSFLDQNALKLGYSFDYVIQERDAKEPTSHEVFIRYNLPDLVFGGRKAVKTPRFTF